MDNRLQQHRAPGVEAGSMSWQHLERFALINFDSLGIDALALATATALLEKRHR